MKPYYFIVGIALLLLLAGAAWFGFERPPEPFSPPEGGVISYHNASAHDITVELPFPGAVVGKEFNVVGEARGRWYFEASFPVDLRKPNGEVLVQHYAQAQDEWMTEDFVPFKADFVVLDQTYIGPAILTLHRDNPSGLPEHDASISFPITVEY